MSMKKLFSLIVLVVMIMTAASFAVADELEPPVLIGPEFVTDVTEWIKNPDGEKTPSISSDDWIKIIIHIRDTDFVIFYITDPNGWAKWYQPEVDAIVNHVAEGNPVLSYFPDWIVADVMGQFEEGTDKDSLVCYEIEAVGDKNYKAKYGDISATAIHPTYYPEDVQAVCILGFCEGTREDGTNIMRWYVQDTTVRDDGTLGVIFTQEVLERMMEGHGIHVTVCNPIVTEAE